MRLQIFILSLLLFTLFSCSEDDNIVKKSQPDCNLIAYTDSSNYFFEVEYNNGSAEVLYNYRFVDGKKDILLRRIELNRNFFNEITHINYYNKDGEFEGVDSIYTNNNGLPFDNITYNSSGEMVEKRTMIYNKDENVIQEKNFRYEDRWVLNIIYNYEYDSEGRVISSAREQISDNGSQFDSTYYTYDNMKNISSQVEIFSVFKTNNFLTVTTVYTLNSGKTSTETKFYEHEYNEQGYPIKTKITSSVNSNDVKFRYNIIDCPN